MKKLIYLLLIISIGNFSCGPICACSPAMAELYLVIRSKDGDLLNPKTNGYFKQDQIKLTLKRANGQESPVAFKLNPPISYGKIKLSYYQLLVTDAPALVYQDFELYLTLPNRQAVPLKLRQSKDARKIEEIAIDGVTIPSEKKFPINSLFYYTL